MKKLYFMAIALVIPGIFSYTAYSMQQKDLKYSTKNPAFHLQMAISSNDLEQVKKAIENGADINDDSISYINPKLPNFTMAITPLAYAAKMGNTTIADFLLKKGAQPKGSNPTALMLAAANGHLEIVKKLVNAGAELNIKSPAFRKKAIQMAKENNHTDVVNYLESQKKTNY